jgi:mycoredoxin
MDRPVVYGADWCGLTRGFRNYLETLGIDYHYLNVEANAFAAEAVRAMNGGKLKFPMVVVGGQAMKNPKLRELNAALNASGLLHHLGERGRRPLVSAFGQIEDDI